MQQGVALSVAGADPYPSHGGDSCVKKKVTNSHGGGGAMG